MNIRSLFGLIQDVSIRLNNAVIENQDFEILIKHYDRDNAFSTAIRLTIQASMFISADSLGMTI